MNIHHSHLREKTLSLNFLIAYIPKNKKTISNNSIPVNVHTDFLFRLLKSVDAVFRASPWTLGRRLGLGILRFPIFASSVFSNFLFALNLVF